MFSCTTSNLITETIFGHTGFSHPWKESPNSELYFDTKSNIFRQILRSVDNFEEMTVVQRLYTKPSKKHYQIKTTTKSEGAKVNPKFHVTESSTSEHHVHLYGSLINKEKRTK